MPKQTLPKKKRLAKARSWIENYDGQHIVKGYRQHFGVDRMTAIRDLFELGALDEETSRRLQEQEMARI